jgi:hypothetical protein
VHLPLAPIARPLGRDLRADACRDATEVLGPRPATGADPVTEAELAGLPEAAQRYLRWMDVVGRPRDRSFLVRFVGRFKRVGQPWMPCEAWQFNAADPVTRLFHLRIDFARVVPMVGRDSYVGGRGAMRGKVAGLVTVADGSGPEFDLGELVTYLNDALLLAPSMVLTDATQWLEVDADSFDVSLTDGANAVTARVTVDDRGRLLDFSTEDRWCDLPDGLVRARWSTPVMGWTEVGGRPWPTGARAIWHLPDGPLPYVEGSFVAESMARNVGPGAWG